MLPYPDIFCCGFDVPFGPKHPLPANARFAASLGKSWPSGIQYEAKVVTITEVANDLLARYMFSMSKIANSFAEFWPIYLRAHSVPLCRALHYCASICGLAALALLFATGNLWWLAFGLVGSYAFAWAGHFKVENNVPLTFKHPLWSLIADYRMFFLWATGRLGQHLAAAGVTART